MVKANTHKITLKQIFLYLLLLNFLLFLFSIIFWNGKISLSKKTSLSFVSFPSLLSKDTSHQVNLDQIIDDVSPIDSTLEIVEISADDKKLLNRELEQNRIIQYQSSRFSELISFFQALIQLENQKNHLRILHYGDSQLEGDRISDYLRNRMQLRFGGMGPGYLQPKEPTALLKQGVKVRESNNWKKFAVYGKGQKMKDGYYGIGGASFKYSTSASNIVGYDTIFKPIFAKKQIILKDTLDKDSAQKIIITFDSSKIVGIDTIAKPIYEYYQNRNATISINLQKNSYPKKSMCQNVSLYYGSKAAIPIEAKIDGLEMKDSLQTGFPIMRKTWRLDQISNKIYIDFKGGEPIIYGLSLDGDNGISVDNFPMRGSSGLGFTSINQSVLNQMYSMMNVKLIILQFGINVVPNPRKNYKYYENMLTTEINAIKKAAPNVSILIIGPSDMSRRTANGYESYPNIELIRNAMKNAAFNTGSAFWDLYEAMGGRNSMVSWVQNKPSLAAKDYTHFNASGAKYVGEMLYNALMKEYLEYKQITP